MKNYKLYNVFFPIWFLIFLPAAWLLVFPANFAIDSAVLLLGAHFFLKGRAKEIWKKSILKVFVFGFLSDFVGAGFLTAGLFASSYFENSTVFEEAINGAQSVGAFFVLLFAVLVSAVCIYFVDLKISFKKIDAKVSEKKKLALLMAVATAPYTFFIPLY